MKVRKAAVKKMRGLNPQQRSFDGGSPQTFDGECICGDCRLCRLAMKDIDVVLGIRSRLEEA